MQLTERGKERAVLCASVATAGERLARDPRDLRIFRSAPGQAPPLSGIASTTGLWHCNRRVKGTASRQPRRQADGQEALRASISAVAKGDKDALRTLFDRTSAKLFGVCLRILKDRQEAEDALQDVYVSVWHRAESFDPARASVISWLATIARNRAIDRLRSSRSRGDSVGMDAALEVADEAPDALARVIADQESERLHTCMADLEERARRTIRAAFFDGLAYSQLASDAGVPLGTMKSWIRRGLQQLRKCLET